MRARRIWVVAVMFVLGAVGAVAAAETEPAQVPKQDYKFLHWVERALPWYPDSTFTIVKDERHQTPSGSYRVVEVKRDCGDRYLSGVSSWLIDEVAGTAWTGALGNLPPQGAGLGPEALKKFLETFLPEAMRRSLRMSTQVSWDSGGIPSGALIPFTLEAQSGYGQFAKPVAMTADGKLLMLGSSLPYDQDPVAYRKQELEGSRLVMWDHPSPKAQVDIVEFSDFECPACKAKWPIIRQTLEKYGAKVRHGMVNLPLTTIHPWSFRAASAAWCVASQNPDLLLPLKEQFYSLQGQMMISLVESTAEGFVSAHDLDGVAFSKCYLATPSLSAVNSQLTLGQDLGINATPTYFVNGWEIQMPTEAWFVPLIGRLATGQEP
jgi:protein-disulfide isomerase